ncbi:DEAD/DEAH box helicase, partial [Limobrevibacterium gyesilva]
DAAPLVRAEMARRLPALAALAPQELAPPRVVAGPPVPVLRLFAGSVPFDVRLLRGGGPRPGWNAGRWQEPMARLSFRYGPVTLPALQPGPGLHAHEGALLQIRRDAVAERDAAGRLAALDFLPLGAMHPVFAQDPHRDDFLLNDSESDLAGWLDVMLDALPALRRDGWQVEIADDFPIRLATLSGDIEARISEGSGIDWFELDVGVSVDGARIDLVPPLLGLIEREGLGLFAAADEVPGEDAAQVWITLDDGRLLPLPMARIRPIAVALLELFNPSGDKDGQVGLSRLRAAELAALEAETAGRGIVWQGGDSLRALGRQLHETGSIPRANLPAGFRAVLRPYQARGVDWLQFLRAAGLGGVLADDMGLGKTVQTLAHIAIEQAAGRLDRPALIVCPTSLVANWRLEAARFAPALKLLTLHGPARKDSFAAIPRHDLVLTTYPLLTRDHAALAAQDWHIVVLDEAQTIKNPQADTSRRVRGLRARQRLCLSGTPLENHLGELWSLFDFVAPGFLGDRRGFQARYRTPIEKAGNAERRTLLARRIRPFLLRRTKDEVTPDLPPKTEIPEAVDMAADQRAVYESIRLAMHARVRAAIAARGLARSGIIVLDALLKLRQACCDPRLLKLASVRRSRTTSAKFNRLMELLPHMIADGRRILLFSQFTEMLGLIQDGLAAAKLPHALLTGDTRDRATPIRRFQAGEVPLFLISLKAGGTGLNLTAADTVIHYDPWWNPAVEDQATDRAHRIGQDKAVFVHKLVTLGTIEEKMEVLKQRKRALAAGILHAERGGALRMTEADVEELFAAA